MALAFVKMVPFFDSQDEEIFQRVEALPCACRVGCCRIHMYERVVEWWNECRTCSGILV